MKVKNLQKLLIALFLNVNVDLEDISNEDKESCDDVGKKEDLEDISNEGKESQKPLIAIIQNVMMLTISLQVKKKI
jgi:hypothetical protein